MARTLIVTGPRFGKEAALAKMRGAAFPRKNCRVPGHGLACEVGREVGFESPSRTRERAAWRDEVAGELAELERWRWEPAPPLPEFMRPFCWYPEVKRQAEAFDDAAERRWWLNHFNPGVWFG